MTKKKVILLYAQLGLKILYLLAWFAAMLFIILDKNTDEVIRTFMVLTILGLSDIAGAIK